VIKFGDLFEEPGSTHAGAHAPGLRYSARCAALSGQDIEICGWIAVAHDGTQTVMLVSRPGDCPDCSSVPVPAIVLPGFRVKNKERSAVVLRGRLSYGLAFREGKASWLRLERARVSTGLWV
jgi:hypothetical protein